MNRILSKLSTMTIGFIVFNFLQLSVNLAYADINLLKHDKLPKFDKARVDLDAETNILLEWESSACALFSNNIKSSIRCTKTFTNILGSLTHQEPERCFLENPINILNCYAYAKRWWLPSHKNKFNAINSSRWGSEPISSINNTFKAQTAGKTLFHLNIFKQNGEKLASHCKLNSTVEVEYRLNEQLHVIDLERWIRPSQKLKDEPSCILYGFANLESGKYNFSLNNIHTKKASIALIRLD